MKLPIKKLSEAKYIVWISVIYTVFITIVFFLPPQKTSPIPFSGADKIIHVLIHFLLIILWLFYIFSKKGLELSRKSRVFVFILVVLYGIIIEIFQHLFTHSRQADLLDVAANIIGSLIGLLLFQNITKTIKA